MNTINGISTHQGDFRIMTTFGRRMAALFLLVAALGGCAAQRLHEDGQALIDQGRYEEGLAKLAEAAKTDPEDLSHRSAVTRNRDQIVNRLLANANDELAVGHPDAAEAIYRRILRIDPGNTRAQTGLDALVMRKRHEALLAEAASLIKKGDSDKARADVKQVLLENPRQGEALNMQRQLDEQAAKERSEEPTLKGKFKRPVTLQFRDANIKMVFEALSRTSGINILLDKDVRPDLKISIFVNGVSVEDTIDLILLQSQLEKKLLSDNSVFIYPNTPAKLKEYQDLKIRSFHLNNADPKQIMTMLKTLLKTKDIFIHEKTNSIVMRDTPDAIRLAEKLVSDQDVADPEVMLEVEVLEVGRNRLSDIGIVYPNQVTLTGMTSHPSSTPSTGGTGSGTGTGTGTGSTGTTGSPVVAAAAAAGINSMPTLNDLRKFYWRDIIVSPVLSATVNLKLQDSDTNIIASPRIRVRNHEKAKVMIGDRVPVITNAITPVSTGSPVVTGSVQYLDVGMKLEVEPDIHPDDEVAIKINLDVSSIVQSITNPVSGTLAYQIGTRNATTVLRLKDGETQILAGLISDNDREAASKVPGLGQLPVLGRLFSDHNRDKQKTEIVLSITPRIVARAKSLEAREVEYWSGTESTLRNTSLTFQPLGKIGAATEQLPFAPAGGPRQLAAPPAAMSQAAAAQPDGMVPALAWLGPKQAKVGDKISLTLRTPAAQGAKTLGFTVAYDPRVLKAVNVVGADAPPGADGKPTFNKKIDQDSGRIEVAGAGGTGNVVTLGFEVIGVAPEGEISVSDISAVAENGDKMAFAAPPPHPLAVAR